MALIEDSILEGQVFADALRQVCFFFQIEKLYEDQVSAIKSVLKGKDIFFCASSGYGESIVFQCIPLLTDILLDQSYRNKYCDCHMPFGLTNARSSQEEERPWDNRSRCVQRAG